jgi:hypothetical protein
MSLIIEAIKKNKPNISESSIKTYDSILRNLYKKVFDDKEIDMKKFDDTKSILKFLEDIPANKRKTILSSLVVITDNMIYRNQMLEDIETYKATESTQEKTDKQLESWVDITQIDNIYNELYKNVKVLYKKDNLTMADLQYIQNLVILSVLGGKFIPPRRSKDYVDFKIKDIDQDKDNYIQKKKLIFNSYKTSKTYARQEITIPQELSKVLKKWIEINPTDYLLFDSNKNKLSNVKLNQRLNKIFGKKASVNQMRHTYLSDKYQKTIELNKKMAEDMEAMGSSRSQESIYIKKSN